MLELPLPERRNLQRLNGEYDGTSGQLRLRVHGVVCGGAVRDIGDDGLCAGGLTHRGRHQPGAGLDRG